MRQKLSLVVLVFLFSSVLFSYSNTEPGFTENQMFKCEFIPSSEANSCSGDLSSIAFYAKGNQTEEGELINAFVSRDNSNGLYDKALCCTSDFEVNINFEFRQNSQCGASQYPFAYLSNLTNARLSTQWHEQNYPHSVCLDPTEITGGLDVQMDDSRLPQSNDWSSAGYSCMYRMSNQHPLSVINSQITPFNARVSSCDATFGSNQQYPITVFARLTPNIETTSCNPDCTSRFDGRIYASCVNQLSSCTYVPSVCDGSLVGQWTNFDEGREVLCQSPFNQYRAAQAVSDSIRVSTRDEGVCRDIVTQRYTVIINAEPVTMNVYICND